MYNVLPLNPHKKMITTCILGHVITTKNFFTSLDWSEPFISSTIKTLTCGKTDMTKTLAKMNCHKPCMIGTSLSIRQLSPRVSISLFHTLTHSTMSIPVFVCNAFCWRASNTLAKMDRQRWLTFSGHGPSSSGARPR